MRVGSQFFSELPSFDLIEFGSEDRLQAARRKCRLHHYGIEMIQHPIECVWLPAPPGRDGWKFQRLAKQVPGKARQERHNRGGFNQATSERVRHTDISSHDGVDQTGHTEKGIAS